MLNNLKHMKTDKQLPQITLVSIDCINPEMATEALKISSKHIRFSDVLLLSNERPFNCPNEISFQQISKISNIHEYNTFILNNLNKYIKTDFCLIIQADGFISNHNKWSDRFLNYDYVGAPWPSNQWFNFNKPEKYRVGNGGFSLRSKKLLNLTPNLPLYSNEDVVICVASRELLENAGVKIAPLEIAKYFAQEEYCEDLNVDVNTDCFGFHGKNLTSFNRQKLKELAFEFYKSCLIQMPKKRLVEFLRNEVGVSDANYFDANFVGNLEVQQIPEEYCNLLTFFKNTDIKTYLELGVANGGSFFVNSIFMQQSASIIHCVDCLAYKDFSHIKQTDVKILNKVNRLKQFFPEKEFNFFNSTTDDFFDQNTLTYDCIFIDADHSYEGVMKDYKNSLRFVNKPGYLIFHDISNTNTGVAQCWNEVSKLHKIEAEYKHPYNNNCGIGILSIA